METTDTCVPSGGLVEMENIPSSIMACVDEPTEETPYYFDCAPFMEVFPSWSHSLFHNSIMTAVLPDGIERTSFSMKKCDKSFWLAIKDFLNWDNYSNFVRSNGINFLSADSRYDAYRIYGGAYKVANLDEGFPTYYPYNNIAKSGLSVKDFQLVVFCLVRCIAVKKPFEDPISKTDNRFMSGAFKYIIKLRTAVNSSSPHTFVRTYITEQVDYYSISVSNAVSDAKTKLSDTIDSAKSTINNAADSVKNAINQTTASASAAAHNYNTEREKQFEKLIEILSAPIKKVINYEFPKNSFIEISSHHVETIRKASNDIYESIKRKADYISTNNEVNGVIKREALERVKHILTPFCATDMTNPEFRSIPTISSNLNNYENRLMEMIIREAMKLSISVDAFVTAEIHTNAYKEVGDMMLKASAAREQLKICCYYNVYNIPFSCLDGTTGEEETLDAEFSYGLSNFSTRFEYDTEDFVSEFNKRSTAKKGEEDVLTAMTIVFERLKRTYNATYFNGFKSVSSFLITVLSYIFVLIKACPQFFLQLLFIFSFASISLFITKPNFKADDMGYYFARQRDRFKVLLFYIVDRDDRIVGLMGKSSMFNVWSKHLENPMFASLSKAAAIAAGLLWIKGWFFCIHVAWSGTVDRKKFSRQELTSGSQLNGCGTLPDILSDDDEMDIFGSLSKKRTTKLEFITNKEGHHPPMYLAPDQDPYLDQSIHIVPDVKQDVVVEAPQVTVKISKTAAKKAKKAAKLAEQLKNAPVKESKAEETTNNTVSPKSKKETAWTDREKQLLNDLNNLRQEIKRIQNHIDYDKTDFVADDEDTYARKMKNRADLSRFDDENDLARGDDYSDHRGEALNAKHTAPKKKVSPKSDDEELIREAQLKKDTKKAKKLSKKEAKKKAEAQVQLEFPKPTKEQQEEMTNKAAKDSSKIKKLVTKKSDKPCKGCIADFPNGHFVMSGTKKIYSHAPSRPTCKHHNPDYVKKQESNGESDKEDKVIKQMLKPDSHIHNTDAFYNAIFPIVDSRRNQVANAFIQGEHIFCNTHVYDTDAYLDNKGSFIALKTMKRIAHAAHPDLCILEIPKGVQRPRSIKCISPRDGMNITLYFASTAVNGGKKSLSTGNVTDTNFKDYSFGVNNSTVDGSCGGVYVDNATGYAVGIHFLGSKNASNRGLMIPLNC